MSEEQATTATETEGQVTEGTESAAEATAQTEQEETEGVNAEDAVMAKLQGVDLESAETQASEEKGDSEGSAEADGKPEAEATEPETKAETPTETEGKLDSDLVKFAKAKGVTEDQLSGSDVLRQQMKNYMENEKRVNRLESEQAKAKEAETAKVAETLEEEAGVSDEGSPLDQVNQTYRNALQAAASIAKCSSIEEYAQKRSDDYAAIVSEWQAKQQEAITETVNWQFEQRDKQAKEKEMRSKLETERELVKKTYEDNLRTAKENDPHVEANLFASGAMGTVQRIANALQFPQEYLTADPQTFQFFAKAAKAITFLDNVDKHNEALKQEWEAGRAKAASANLPASRNATPPTNERVLETIFHASSEGGY